jgi:glycosyltransferase involved in cell wall biosynthesis
MQHLTKPRVAVVIPVYRAEFLDQCLASVFGQTVQPDQVVVIDDGSPDGERVAAAVRRYEGKVTLLRQENAGAGAARNRGIMAAGCDLVAFLDADDEWLPGFLERQLQLIGEAPDTAFVYANGQIVGDSPLSGTLFMDTAPSEGSVTVEALLAQRCTVLTSSVVARRQALVDNGLFDESLRRGQDFDMWLRLVAAGAKCAYTRNTLVKRRVHGQNLSGDRMTELDRAITVLSRLRDKLQLTEQQRHTLENRVRALRAEMATENGKRMLAAGDVSGATAHFRQAVEDGAGWKSWLVHLALQIAPETTRQAYLFKLRRGAATTPIQPA